MSAGFRVPKRLWHVSRGVVWLAILVGAAGCPKKGAPKGASPPPDGPPALVNLKLLVVDDPPLADAIRQQWATRGEGKLEITTAASADLLSDAARLPSCDVAIFPPTLLGQFVRRQWIVAFPAALLEDPVLQWSDILLALRLRETYWNRQVMAIPLGAATPLLWYRADLWAKHQLPPPETWDDLAAAVKKLKELEPGVGSGTAEPLAPGWAARTLLARSAAYAQHGSYLSVIFHPDDMHALIDSPPFTRALEELVATAIPDSSQRTPDQTPRDVLEGKAVAAVGWSPRDVSDWPAVPGDMELAVVPLPGSRQSYDRQRTRWDERREGVERVTLLGYSGRLGAVSRKASNERAAASLLVLLSGRDWGDQVLPVSHETMVFRHAQAADPRRWVDVDRWGETLAKSMISATINSFDSQPSLPIPAIPGIHEYLQALDTAVLRAVRGEARPDEALKEAAKEWDAITARRGVEAQREAYRESLGL